MRLMMTALLLSGTLVTDLATSNSWASEAEAALLHPLFDEPYVTCTEHWAGQLPELGDALGADCFVERLETIEGRTWLRRYANRGLQNEDWYSWQEPVLAPITGTVQKININSVMNPPGIMGNGPASYLIITDKTGLSVVIAHLTRIRVKVGEEVSAGQSIGHVGNNGQSRQPHIHVGAWRGEASLQVRFDLTKPIH